MIHKTNLAWWLACFALLLVPPVACAQSADRYAVFFSARPTQIPSGMVVLRVRAPAGIDRSSGFTNVAILEPVDEIRDLDKVDVKIDPVGQNCDFGCDGPSYEIGVVGAPAYILGKIERTESGSIYFHAIWWPSKFPDFRKGKKPDDYIVDPAYLPKTKAQ